MESVNKLELVGNHLDYLSGLWELVIELAGGNLFVGFRALFREFNHV